MEPCDWVHVRDGKAAMLIWKRSIVPILVGDALKKSRWWHVVERKLLSARPQNVESLP